MKKKIGIITILDVANFGTMLQAYALAKKIEDADMEAMFINYMRPDYTVSNKFKTFCTDKTLGNIVKRVGFGLASLILYSYIRNKTRRFVIRNFSFTKCYNSIATLRKNPPKADLYITGSDQVWNSTYNEGVDPTFFLDFVEAKKVAYAASVGISEFPDNELPSIKAMLGKYQYLSVRETQTADYFHQIGFPDTEQVLDPTLLLNIEDWKQAIHYKKDEHEPYLLVYSVERFNNDFIFEQARKIAKAKNLKMYVVCSTYPVKAKKYGFDKIYAMASVEQFVSLMIDADFIVASSFHGTAFSVNFNKEFITISAKKFNIRMESFIRQFDIAHRIVGLQSIDANQLFPIDYTSINKKMDAERHRSIEYLNKILHA